MPSTRADPRRDLLEMSPVTPRETGQHDKSLRHLADGRWRVVCLLCKVPDSAIGQSPPAATPKAAWAWWDAHKTTAAHLAKAERQRHHEQDARRLNEALDALFALLADPPRKETCGTD